MRPSPSPVGWVLALAIGAAGACTGSAPGLELGLGHTAAPGRPASSSTLTVPAGYLFAANGSHVRNCVGTKCATMWSDDEAKSSNNCGGGFPPIESYIIHQRGVDWDGLPGEPELLGNEYRLTER